MQNNHQVLLPAWIFEQGEDTEHIRKLVKSYMAKRYPGYVVKQVVGHMAICDTGR